MEGLKQERIFDCLAPSTIKGCRWLTRGLITLAMKADNELEISLPI